MPLQIFFLVMFAISLAMIWLAVLNDKCEWCQILGTAVFTVIPFITVFFRQPHFELDFFWWRIAGVVAIGLGAGISFLARKEFRSAGMWSTDLPKALVSAGPYKFVRHPQFLGLIFMWVGWWWLWAAVYSFYFGMIMLVLTWVQAYLEEKFILEKKFGAAYREYRQHAGMFWVK